MPRFMLAIPVLMAFAPACPASGDDGVAKARAAEVKKYEATAREVWRALAAHAGPMPGPFWPPQFLVVDEIRIDSRRVSRYNAVASFLATENGRIVRVFGRRVPLVRITRGYLALFGGDENVLALVLGHELGHHVLGHTGQWATLKPGALAAAYGHRREADADRFGAELMLKAGYSLRKAARFKWLGMERLEGGLYSAAEGTCLSHPGTADRLARLFALLDKGEEDLWRGMSAFENGVTFLATENFLPAESCFLRVTREFPRCYEAHANLGLARLLRYCDGLSAEDVRRLGVGHVLGSTYYPTARSLVATRGERDKLWQDAVESLQRAQELRPGSPLILANLGLAYLVHPGGKAAGLGEATKYLGAALVALDRPDGLTPRTRAALLVNFGVAAIADGKLDRGQKLLAEAETLAGAGPDGARPWLSALGGAVAFNTAVALTPSDRRGAAREYEKFLGESPRSNPWWPVAYERYEALCKAAGATPRAKAELGKKPPLRKQLAVALPAGGAVHVGEAVGVVVRELGPPDRETRVEGTGLRRLHYDARGVYLIADPEEVFAVVVASAAGPRVVLREAGLGGKVLGEIRVGMPRKELEALPGGKTDVQRPFLGKNAAGQYYLYDFYPDLGVALTFDTGGAVTTIIVGQLGEFLYD